MAHGPQDNRPPVRSAPAATAPAPPRRRPRSRGTTPRESDPEDAVLGLGLETHFLHRLRAANGYGDLGYAIHYWRTAAGHEVDFVLYGERGLRAFEVKAAAVVRDEDLQELLRFREDYPMARAHLLHLRTRRWDDRGIEIVPLVERLTDSGKRLGQGDRAGAAAAKPARSRHYH